MIRIIPATGEVNLLPCQAAQVVVVLEGAVSVHE